MPSRYCFRIDLRPAYCGLLRLIAACCGHVLLLGTASGSTCGPAYITALISIYCNYHHWHCCYYLCYYYHNNHYYYGKVAEVIATVHIKNTHTVTIAAVTNAIIIIIVMVS